MRFLNKNMREIYYSNYLDKVPKYELDSNGNVAYMEMDGQSIPVETGDMEDMYSEPTLLKAYISTGTGNVNRNPFGLSINYDRIILTKKDVDINEASILWVESEPNLEIVNFQDTADYIVVGVADSLNHKHCAVKRITKSGD